MYVCNIYMHEALLILYHSVQIKITFNDIGKIINYKINESEKLGEVEKEIVESCPADPELAQKVISEILKRASSVTPDSSKSLIIPNIAAIRYVSHEMFMPL